MAKEIVQGMVAAHAAGVVNRDLKPANILFSVDGVCKVADFGEAMSAQTTVNINGLRGTFAYMAPEVALNNEYSFKADTWAVGCCVLQMLTGHMPWFWFESGPTGFPFLQQLAQPGSLFSTTD